MTEASKKKEEAKKNIRSVLQSAKGGLTLHELRRDYNDFFFSELPGKEFGYHSTEDFLKDIPDVVEVRRFIFNITIIDFVKCFALVLIIS